jgi:hypothetical protein
VPAQSRALQDPSTGSSLNRLDQPRNHREPDPLAKLPTG